MYFLVAETEEPSLLSRGWKSFTLFSNWLMKETSKILPQSFEVGAKLVLVPPTAMNDKHSQQKKK